MAHSSSGVVLPKPNSRSDLQEGKQYRPEFHSWLHGEEGNQKLWELMAEYIDAEPLTIQKEIVKHVECTLARTRFNFDQQACYRATALSIRDRMIEAWNDTQQHFTSEDCKRMYYMSLEFLIGRLMQNNLINLNLESRYRNALMELGFKLEDLYEEETDPALGNGGLGRLAACFLDSLATLNFPAWGYGIRYDYGIFRQRIIHGYQVEIPDYWLSQGNPWEIERTDISYDIHFYGHVQTQHRNGQEVKQWIPGETVIAIPYDTPISGYNTFNTINLRLWRSRPYNEFDFNSFNEGNYFKAIEDRQRAEYITSVLYPNDSTEAGKELRLKQQYFFCSATIQDVLRRFLKKERDWEDLPEKAAIQLNDTHPAIAIPELLRILVDVYELNWQRAWTICHRVFSYTNHTVLPEALEKWSVDLIGRLLPRHLEIIYLINFHFMQQVGDKFKNDDRRHEMMREMSVIEEGMPKKVRMANLCVLSSHKVNGVAALHTNLVKEKILAKFNQYFPDKFINMTNGVTPRRWINCANPELGKLYTKYLGSWDWLTNLSLLRELLPKSEDPSFQQEWQDIKIANKEKLVEWVHRHCGVTLTTEYMFDIMVKRIHEYKRQLLFALFMIHRYLSLKRMSPDERKNVVKRAFMVGGKAAPGYAQAKRCIKLINAIGEAINDDPDTSDYIKVVFLPNYCVSAAQVIIPAAEVNQQISTAGTEASGTGNMKFVMNGALIIGTMDGANVEIAEEIGEENMFIFGARLHEVDSVRERVRSGRERVCGELKEVFGQIKSGRFGNPRDFLPLVEPLEQNNDYYIVCYDFQQYIQAQRLLEENYKDRQDWVRKSILGAVLSGKFSSDRTIEEYAEHIWGLEKVPIPTPSASALTRVRSQPHLVDNRQRLQNARQTRQDTVSYNIQSVEQGKLEELLNSEDDTCRLPVYEQESGEGVIDEERKV